eukprot:COSAG02_NODE_472_length_21636_cov_767.911366_14_plen_846_part_00
MSPLFRQQAFDPRAQCASSYGRDGATKRPRRISACKMPRASAVFGPEPSVLAEPMFGNHATGFAANQSGHGGAPISRLRSYRVLLALSLAVALASPVGLPLGMHWVFKEATDGEICPFIPTDGPAQRRIEELFKMTHAQREAALGQQCLRARTDGDCSPSISLALQLLQDADSGIFSETWIASAPSALRNSFLVWLAVKLFFTATDLQDRGGLVSMTVVGHGARGSVVGERTASAAGWLATVGEPTGADLSVAIRIWGFALLAGTLGATVAVCLVVGLLIEASTTQCLGGCAIGLLITTLPAFYFLLRDLPTSSNQHQPTWEDARKALGLTPRQANGISVIKFSLWHWSQPVAYIWIFRRYYCCSNFMDTSQQAIGSIVAAREVMYMISTVVAIFACPVYLLLDVQTVVQEAETRFQVFCRLFTYLVMPHNFVSLCLANRSVELQLVFLPLTLCQVIADFASCFALGPLMFSSTDSPLALKIGYAVTSASFLFFFGPLVVLSLLRTARDKVDDGGADTQGRIARVCAAVAGTTLGLGLLYIIISFTLAAFDYDVVCHWLWLVRPDCGEHSVCGAVVRGECGPCTGNFITSSDALHHIDNSQGDLCQVDCSLTNCGPHGRWDGRIADARVAGSCGCTCFDNHGGDRCEFNCTGSPFDCGEHGRWEDPVAGICSCTCLDGYVTRDIYIHSSEEAVKDQCRLAPAYVVSGAPDSAYNGRYDRLEGHKCGSAPVWQLGGEGGKVLYNQGVALWAFGPSERIKDCNSHHDNCVDHSCVAIGNDMWILMWTGDVLHCADSPAGDSCDFSTWAKDNPGKDRSIDHWSRSLKGILKVTPSSAAATVLTKGIRP